MSTLRPFPPRPGVACGITWDRQRPEMTFWGITGPVWHRLNPVVAERADDLVSSTWPPPGDGSRWTLSTEAHVADEPPYWPATPAGLRLRQLYLDQGERALCSAASLGDRLWWTEDDWYRIA